jgi:hypothetical protein
MAPVYVKGGMWTNVEDEILKAAIAKYGLNQWSRVSSLLTKKNARQCKLRWQEWLDPRIRKSEWSPEEDQKLLNLAKLRPNQWSSICLLMNRTANQCIERYQELLTDYAGGINGLIDDDKSITSKLLLTGNIESTNTNKISSFGGLNLNPESKPARPDLEEMDEDEREMISEAKARLANTQGKKAKRKAREKILEESKRVADLLRRRELKQVGINAQLKIKKTFKDQMDYNADIAFERRPEKGKFDTTNEIKLNVKEKMLFDKNAKVKGTFNQEVNAQKRKEKRRREQNKKLVETTERKRQREDELSEDDTLRFMDEFTKRRKFTFDNHINDNDNVDMDIDIDNTISQTLQEIKDKNSGKSLVFSRKYHEDTESVENNNVELKMKDKLIKKREKELKKRLVEALGKLPEAQDDFELDLDNLIETDKPELILNHNHKKSGHIIVDKTEKLRNERKRIIELKEELQHLETPESIKRDLPTIYHLPILQTTDEIDLEMFRIIQGSNTLNVNSDIEDLEKTISLRKEIETLIEKQVEIEKDGRYEKLLSSSKPISYTKAQLIRLIEQYTKSSNEIEQHINFITSKQKQELQMDKILEEISKKQKELIQLDNEIWVYQQFQELESESINIRQARLQKELDYVNMLIDQKRHAILS